MQKKKIAKYSLSFILFICLLVIGITGFRQYKTYAAHGNPSDPGYIEYKGYDTIYLDDNGNFIYQTLDKKKVSNLHYKTIGFTFSRIKRGIGNPKTSSDPYVGGKNNRETVLCPLTDASAQYTLYEYPVGGTTWIVSQWTLPYEFVVGCIKQDPDWWAEIEDMLENDEDVYIGCDAILTTCTDTTYADGSIRHKVAGVFFNGKPYGKYWDYTNYQDLFKIFGSAKNIASIKSHYDKFFLLNRPGNPPPDEITGKYVFIKNKLETSKQKNKSPFANSSPDTFTYNYDDKFDIGTAIPTTEEYKNGIQVDPWFGGFSVDHNENVSKTNTFTWTASYTVVTYETKTNEDGSTSTIRHETPGSASGLEQRVRTGDYWEIADLGLYELYDSTVTNDFSETYYDDITQTIPFSIRYCDKSWSTGTKMIASDLIYTKGDIDTGWSIIPAKYKGHVEIPKVDDTPFHINIGEVSSAGAGNAAAQAQAKAIIDGRMEGKDIITTNDELNLNGVAYLTQDGLFTTDESILAAAQSGGWEIEQGVDDAVSTLKPQWNERDVLIPQDTANDNYYTSIDTVYNTFCIDNGLHGTLKPETTISVKDKESEEDDKKAILSGYEQNEPVKVHSPVFSPISIDDSGSTKQAVSRGSNGYNADGSVNWYPQLNPDGTYIVKFDWDDYFQKKYGNSYGAPAGWTKYVLKKQVAFPFTVEYNNVIYEPEPDTGLTEWIDVDPDGTKTEFTIYIPAWAKEGIYGDNGTLPIKVKCYANNYVMGTQEAEHYKENDEASAGDPEHKQYYVATYDYPVQITGVMYDFTVTGINDEILFGGLEEESTGVWNFVDHNTEHKVGTYNRFNIPLANSAIAETTTFYDRTTFPGNDNTHTWLHTLLNWNHRKNSHAPLEKEKPLAVQNWPETDTLPFTTGKSDQSTMMGELSLGHTIGFQLKTISSMTRDDANDSIKIVSTYRYVDKNGNVKNPDEIKLYTYNKKNGYVAFDNTQYQESQETSLSDLYFERSFDEDWADFTATKRGTTKTGVLYKAVPDAYNTAGVNIKADNMLYSGDTLQLRVNEQKNDVDKIMYGTGADDMFPTLTLEQENLMKSSMQTWYGEYNIPKSTKVMDVAKFLAYCDREGFYEIAEEQYGCDRSALTVDQLFDTVFQYGLRGNEEWWITDGYLILNFDITAIKNGTEYMSYYKKYDMWSAEAGTWGSPHGERTITVTNMDYSTFTTKIYDGDVAIIKISDASNLKNRVKTNINLID